MSSRYAWFLAVMMLFPMGVVGTDGPALTPVFVKQGGQWQVVASHGSTIPNP